MIKCEICDRETQMDGTRMCDVCYETMKWSVYLFQCFDGDMQVSYERYQPFPWTVQLRQINYTVKGTGQGLKEAFLKAKRQLKV